MLPFGRSSSLCVADGSRADDQKRPRTPVVPVVLASVLDLARRPRRPRPRCRRRR